MQDVTIRPATVDDVPKLHAAIIGIAEHVGAAEQVVSTEADLRRFGFGEHPSFEAVMAEVDGKFAGMCLFFPVFSTWFGRPGVFVQDLFVEKGFRSLGIGERLLRHVARLSRDKGSTYMRLEVAEHNGRAQDFYAGLGFAWAREERSFVALGKTFDALSEAARDQQDIGEQP